MWKSWFISKNTNKWDNKAIIRNKPQNLSLSLIVWGYFTTVIDVINVVPIQLFILKSGNQYSQCCVRYI